MTNKVPEKIYLQEPTKVRTEKKYDNDVEYIRIDVFIEKVCDWLSDNLQTIVDVDCPSEHHIESIPALGSITQTEFLRKFKKEIKYLFD